MTDSHEEWKPIVGHELWYAVSSRGRVMRTAPGCRTRAGNILKGNVTNRGYPFVTLRHPPTNKSHSKLIHNLVSAAFLGPKPPGLQVNHIDGNKLNATISNLEYVTGGDNQRHAFCLGLMKKSLNPTLVREIRLYQGRLSSAAAGAIFGVSSTTVQYIWKRVYWATVDNYDPVDFQNF